MVVDGKYAVKRHRAVLDVAVLVCMATLGAAPPPDAAALDAAREDVLAEALADALNDVPEEERESFEKTGKGE